MDVAILSNQVADHFGDLVLLSHHGGIIRGSGDLGRSLLPHLDGDQLLLIGTGGNQLLHTSGDVGSRSSDGDSPDPAVHQIAAALGHASLVDPLVDLIDADTTDEAGDEVDGAIEDLHGLVGVDGDVDVLEDFHCSFLLSI